MMSSNEARKRERQRKRRTPSCGKRLILTIGLWLLLGSTVGAIIMLLRLRTAAAAVWADIVALESLAASNISDLDLGQTVELLRDTRTDLATLQAVARPFLWMAPYLGWLPRYGPGIRLAPILLQSTLDLTTACERAMTPLVSIVNVYHSNQQDKPDQRGTLRELLKALQAAHPHFTTMLSSIQEIKAACEQLHVEGLSPRIQQGVARLDRYLPLLESGVKGALVLPEALGIDEPRTYLVLVQNEDELRATGGFISGVVRVTVKEGDILESQFEDSYAIVDLSKPYPDPPTPLLEFMLSELWLFRDSNWSPDFPTSAQAAISLYTISHDIEISGVLAIDQQAIRLFVEALAPLLVEGHSEPITGQNVIQMARQFWDPGSSAADDWWQHRKDFMGAVLGAAIRRLEGGLDRASIVRLARAAVQALDEKHLLVYLEDNGAATLTAELGWDGALLQSPGDYLMVVDSNLGFNKVNALIQETLEYVVDLGELDHPQATLTIRHKHPLKQRDTPCRHEPRYDSTYEQMMEQCYWNYLRVYVPAKAQLENATPHPILGQELLSGRPSFAQVTVGPPEQDHNVFATFLLLRPAEILETRFEYALPKDVLHFRDDEVKYELLIQKQPGTNAIPLRVQILLPPRMGLETSDPQPTAIVEAGLEYAFALRMDQTLSIALRSNP